MNAKVISNAARSHEEELRDRLRLAVRRDGGDPSSFLELLADAVKERIWEKLGSAQSFVSFVKTPVPEGLGLDETTLTRLIAFPHHHEDKDPTLRRSLAGMRTEVGRLLREEIKSLPEHGEIGRGRDRDSGTTSNGRGVDYVVARLKRDDPDLAEQVVLGELTANAAARQAGIRRPRIVLSTPERIAASLKRHLDPDTLAALVKLLSS